MMKFVGLAVLVCALLATSSGLPATSRSPAEPDDCSKECINGVAQYGQEISILKNPDLSGYFNKLDEVCEVITTAQKCLESCGATSNPFALESLNIVCQSDTQEKIAPIKQCLRYVGANVKEICAKQCNNDHIIDETADADAKMNPMLQKMNGNCADFKCQSRCNIEVVAGQCGKEIAKELQGLLQQVIDTQRKDLEKLNLVETMEKSSPPECNYLYDPSVLFGGNQQQQQPEESAPAPKEDDAKTLYAQATLQLLLKQIELAEKQDHLIDRENAKLDMEMAYMAHKADRRFFAAQHSLPTFVPMEKMPLPSAMESANQHPESMPSESHPPMDHPQEDPHQEQQPESHAQPSEEQPTHPEQMPSEESHHQEMPSEDSHHHQEQMPSMESNQQQPAFPHPEPMMMQMEIPSYKHHQMPPPIAIIDGMPMEFVPFEAMPMEAASAAHAMPRFN